MKTLRNPLRAVPYGRNPINPGAALSGKALEKRFAIAARENRKTEMDVLARMGDALTERAMIAATSRLRASDRDVPLSRTVIELAYRWRDAKGQTLGSDVALHIGMKILDEQVNDLIAGEIAVRKPTEERREALTQLLSIVEPGLRVTVHAQLLSHLHERAMTERAMPTIRARDEGRSREELQAITQHRVSRIERSGFEFLGKAAGYASAFDGIEAGYEKRYQHGVA